MKTKTFRLPLAAAAITALTVGLITLPGGDDALAAPVTETKSIAQECVEHRTPPPSPSPRRRAGR